MMQLMYLRFMEPRFDTLAHKVIIERNHIYAKQIAGQPQTIMRDSLIDFRQLQSARTIVQRRIRRPVDARPYRKGLP